MPLARFNKLPEAKQTELLRIATEDFTTHGFEEASLSNVLEKAGLSKSSFYYYFEDKEDLLATVLEKLMDRNLSTLTATNLENVTEKTFWPAVEQALARTADFFTSSPELLKILVHLQPVVSSSPRMAALRQRGATHMRAIILGGQRLGCVRTDVPVDRLLEFWEALAFTLQRALVRQATAPMNEEELQGHRRLAFDMFRRVMRVEETATGAVGKKR